MLEIVGGILSLGAIVLLKRALGHREQRSVAMAWEQAQAALARGDDETAIKCLSECVRRAPLWLPARMVLGTLLARHGQLAEAEAQFKMAQALQPREAMGFLELGIFYLTATDRIDEGVAQLRAALAHDASIRSRIDSDPRLETFRASPAYASLGHA